MHSAPFPARQSRTLYRHELRTLSYVTLDEANGGIVRNLSPQGVGVQAVAALHPKQRVRVRFELRSPRLRVDSQGEVAWTEPSGQCGIRFVETPLRTGPQIKEWIFGNLLDSIFRDAHDPPILKAAARSTPAAADDGLILSAAPRPAIQLEPARASSDAQPFLLPREDLHGKELPGQDLQRADPARAEAPEENLDDFSPSASPQLDWLFRPLSARTLAFLIDSLIMIAAFLLFAFVFLCITHELPVWPLGLEAAFGAAIFVPAFYCGLTYMLGGTTPGARLAHIAGYASQDDEIENEKSDEQEMGDEKTADEVRLR
jgi:PilZ domain/RDD family